MYVSKLIMSLINSRGTTMGVNGECLWDVLDTIEFSSGQGNLSEIVDEAGRNFHRVFRGTSGNGRLCLPRWPLLVSAWQALWNVHSPASAGCSIVTTNRKGTRHTRTRGRAYNVGCEQSTCTPGLHEAWRNSSDGTGCTDGSPTQLPCLPNGSPMALHDSP
jgi:hypothetical protein